MSAKRRQRPAPRMIVLGHALDRAPKIATFDRAVSVAEAIRRQRLTFTAPTIAVLMPADSRKEPVPVLRRDWTKRKVRRGETLVFAPVPRGGEGKSILAIVAAIALSAIAGPAGAAISGALFAGSAMAATVISAFITVVGSYLLNALIPKAQTSQAEQTFFAQASSNQALPLGTIPGAFGLMRFPPPLAAAPYAEFEGNEQFLYQLHCASLGKWNAKRWEIGKTLVWTSDGGFTAAFSDIDIEIIQPGGAITLFPANVVVAETVANQQVPDPPDKLGPFTVNGAGTEISAIAVDFVFPGGLYTRQGNGGAGNASRHLVVRYRAIDDLGAPIGAGTWTNLINETITRKTATPQRITRRADVAAGRYEVDFAATDADTSDGGGAINRVLWAGLRGYLTDWVTPPGVTLIATKIRASGQLSQTSANEYFFTGQRCLPIYDAEEEEWSAPAETSSIAWAAAEILRNSDYGAGLADTQFDLAWLAAYDTIWTGRGDRFDGVFGNTMPTRDALDQVLRCGRAFHVRLGGRIGFVRDEPKQVRRHVFGPWNTLRGSHSRQDAWLDSERPDYVRARYLDASVWTDREVTASIGALGATLAQANDYVGMNYRDHVWREAIYDSACNAYRRSFRTFKVEHEGRQLVRGDPVLYHDPLLELAAPARLVERDGDTFTIDRDFTPAEGETYHLVIADKRGFEWGPCEIESFTDARTIVLDTGDRTTVEAQHGNLDDILPNDVSEPARLSILQGDNRLFDGLLVSARPDGKRFWEVLLVNDDQRVHAADETEITPAPYTPPSLYAPPPEAPAIAGIYGVARRGTLHIELEAGWRPSAGAQRYVAEISYDDDADSSPAGASWTPVHDGVGTRFTAVILPQPWTLRVAAVGVRQGLWTYITGTSPEPQLAAGTVTEESLSDAIAAVLAFAEQRLPQETYDLRELIERLATAVNGHIAAVEEKVGQVNIAAGSADAENAAAAQIAVTTATDAKSAVAAIFGSILATTAAGTATAFVRFQAVSTSLLPLGVASSVAIELKAEADGEYAFTGMYLDAVAGGGSRIRLVADAILFQDPAGLISFDAFKLIRGGDTPEPAPIVGGEIQVNLGTRRDIFETLVTGHATLREPLGAWDGARWTHRFKMDSAGGWNVTPAEDVMFGPDPTINNTANILNVNRFQVVRTSPLKIMEEGHQAALEDDPGPLVFVSHLDLGGAFIPCGDAGVGGAQGLVMAVLSARIYGDSGATGNEGNIPNIQIAGETGWLPLMNQYINRAEHSSFPPKYFHYATRLRLDIVRLTGAETVPVFPYAHQALLFSGGGPLAGAGTVIKTAATGNPAAATTDITTQPTPLLLMGLAAGVTTSPLANLNWSSFSPTYDANYNLSAATAKSTLAYKLYDSAPANHTITIANGGKATIAALVAIKAPPF